ncbi:MAG: sulfatase-like hydrolase/transferase [Myxococcota bacterium]
MNGTSRRRWPVREILGITLLAAAVACGGDTDEPRPLAASDPPEPGPSQSPEATAEPAPWNVVLITLDTTRADALGAYGQPRDVTPNIDRMAVRGVLFEVAATSSPSTLPSHASLFTGKQPYAHGARSNLGYVLPAGQATLAEALSAAGYRSAAEIAAAVLGGQSQIAQGFGFVRDTASPGVERKRVVLASDGRSVEYPIRVARDIGRRGREFIRANRNRPFFLWLHFFDAHNPYGPPRAFAAKFPDAPYLAEVAYQDAEVGSVLHTIEELGLRPRTLVVLTADHGEAQGEHGEFSHRYFVYETTMRVPLIFWGPPQLAAGRRVASLVRSVDVAPTILDLLGRPPLSDIQGVSLRPLLSGPDRDLGLTGYGESLELHRVFGVAPLRTVRRGAWKYIHKVNPELYDLAADPGELENLATREPRRVAAFQSELRELLAARSASPQPAATSVDTQTRAALAALGYATPASVSAIDDELASLELVGEDAAAKARDVEQISRTHGWLQSGEFERARSSAADLLGRNPDNASILVLMGKALAGLGRFDEAAGSFGLSVEREPGSVEALLGLADALEKASRRDEASSALRAILEIDACHEIRQKLYVLATGDPAEQYRILAEGVERCPDSSAHLNNFAWVLATVRDDSLRDGKKALALSRRAIELQGHAPGPDHLDTLAAAYAETGDFAEAARQERKALALLAAQKAPADALSAFRKRLAEFEAGRPIRDP